MAPVPRQQTSVIALLDWLRESGVFSRVLLKDFTEDGYRVQVFGVFSTEFSNKYEKRARETLRPSDGALDEQRRVVLRDLLVRQLRAGPELTDVELRAVDYAQEEREDFSSESAVFAIPAAAFLFFQLRRQSAPKKGAKTAAADDPEADAGGPRYVIRDIVAPAQLADPELRADFEADWVRWKPNPDVPGIGPLLDDVQALITPTRPVWRALAAELNARGHKTLTGRAFTEANVWRVAVAAELLVGNEYPEIEN